MINPVSIQPRVIDSSTEKRKQRDSRDLPKKASHQAGEKPSLTVEENPEKESPSFPSGASGQAFLGALDEKGDEEHTPRIDITV